MALVGKNTGPIVESLMTPGLRCTVQQLFFVPPKQLRLLAKELTALLKQLFADEKAELTPKQAEHMQMLLDAIPKMEADAAKTAKAAKTRHTMKKLKGGAAARPSITTENALEATRSIAAARGNYVTVERLTKELEQRRRGVVRKAGSGIWNFIEENSSHLIAMGLSYLLTDSAVQILATTTSMTEKIASAGVLAPAAKVGYGATAAAEWTVNTLGYLLTAGGRIAEAPSVNFGSKTIGSISSAADMSETIRTTFAEIGGNELRRPSFILTFVLLYILLFFVFRLISSDRISFIGIFSFERRGRGDAAAAAAALPMPVPGAPGMPATAGYGGPAAGVFQMPMMLVGHQAHGMLTNGTEHRKHHSRRNRSRNHSRRNRSRNRSRQSSRSRGSHHSSRSVRMLMNHQSSVAAQAAEGWGGESASR